jgi:hypothetical protein
MTSGCQIAFQADPGVAELLAILEEVGADNAVTVLVARIAADASPDATGDFAFLVQVLAEPVPMTRRCRRLALLSSGSTSCLVSIVAPARVRSA